MQLVFERARWEAVTKWGEQAAPKSAGFKWDRGIQRWHSVDVLAAMKLRDFADAATAAKLDAAAEVAKAAKAAKDEAATVAVAASRARDADIEIPIGAGRAFLPYQKAGIAYALARPNVLLGDDMGLGKTAQAIGVINADESLRKILVVCPASLSRNWQREFGMFGSRSLTVGNCSMKEVPATDIVIATYDVFSRRSAASDAIHEITWDCVVLDEAHYLKNGDAKRTKEILGGRTKDDEIIKGISVSKRRLYLTGTPITNRPIELWPLVHSLAPQDFVNKMDFAKRYCAAYRNSFGWDFSGASHLDELQDRLRAVCMVRRLKKDVLTELPAKRRQIIELPADTAEAKAALKAEADAEAVHGAEVQRLRAAIAASADPDAYKAAVAALRSATQHYEFTELSRVRHATAVAKAPQVITHVRDALESGTDKVIVFAHHKDVVGLLATALTDFGVVQITGDTAVSKRQDLVDAFQTDPAIRVFIGNIQAAGTGITLTAASHVVFGELDWTPGNLSQAEDRAHRLGQRNSVLVQHLVLEGSLDARMVTVVTDKQVVIDAALDNVEDPTEREARIAAVQAKLDAATEDAVEAAKAHAAQEDAEATERAAQAVERAAREADRAARRVEFQREMAEMAVERAAREAEERGNRIDASVARAAAVIGAESVPTPQAVAAIMVCLGLLADLDPDGATKQNDEGFSKIDSYHGHHLARQPTLDDAQAIVGRELVRRYQRQLDAELVAVALGEPVRVRRAAKERQAAVAEAVAVEALVPEVQSEAADPIAEASVEPALAGMPVTQVTDFPSAHELADDDGEPVAEVQPEAVAEEPVDEPAPRRRGRPTNASRGQALPLSQVERNRRYRDSKNVVAIDVPGATADRLRAARDARGLSTEQLLLAALNALEATEHRQAA